MKKTKHFYLWLPNLLALLMATIWMLGCTTSRPDPLAGFHVSDLINLDSNKAITDDCKGYIQKLSPEERKYLGPSPIGFFEDGTGQHAVRIEIPINGTWWQHVLIYDKDNKRIKTIKYASGNYRS